MAISGRNVAVRALVPVAVTALFGVAACLLAAAPVRAEVSQADKDACTPDVFRLCAAQIPNEDQIVACLNRKIGKLSPECRVVMQGGSSSRSARNRR